MADMKIAMTLTMADLASPEIQKFKANLAQLGDYLKGLGDSFKVPIGGAADFGKATLDASAGVRQFSRAMGGASRSGGHLGDVLKGLQDQIAGFRMEVAAASVTTNDMGAASMRAGAGLEAMGAKAAAAKGEMAGLHGTMKGLIELYASLKVGEGLKKSVSDAAGYQTQKLQLQQRNLPAGQYRAVLGQANQQAALHPWLTKNDALEAQIASLSELPGNTPFMQQMRGFMAPKLQYLARRAGMYGDKSSFFHRIQNGAGLIDAMGGQQNPSRASWIATDAGQVIAASGGKDTLQSMETSFRALSKILSVNMGQAGFRFFNAGNEEFKAAGGGGAGGNTKMATLLNALTTAAAGGVMGKGAAYVLEATGLIKKADVHKYGHSSTQALVSQGALLNTQVLLHDPGKFIFGTLVPHFEALVMKRWKEHKPGMVNPDTAAGLSQDTAMMATYFSKFKVGGQSLASAMAMFSNPEIQRSILAKERQMQQVATNAQSSHGINATAAGQWKIFHSQLHNLGVNIGTTILPALTGLLRVVNALVVGLNGFVQAFPKGSMFATVGIAILGVVEAIKGLSALLGLGKSFGQMFGLMSASALGADAQIAAGSATTTAEVAANNLSMASTFALTGKGMIASAVEMVAGIGKTFLLGFASFAAGWELWQSIKSFEIAGHTLNAYAGVATMAIAQQFDAMFTYIENGFIRMGGWLDRIGARADAAIGLKGWAAQQSSNAKGAAAAIAANNQAFTFRSHILQSVAMRDWNAKASSGEPGAPTGISPAELLHEANVAALPSVPGGSLNPSGGQSPTDVKVINGSSPFSAAASMMSKNLALLSAKYNAGLMSVSAYYVARKQIVVAGTNAEIAALGRLEAAYKKAGMASQVKGMQVKIGALRNGLALQLQTIGYQQEGAANKLAAKLQAVANKIHAAWAAIVNPLGGKIASMQAKYATISGHLLAGGHMTAAHEALSIGQSKIMGIKYQAGMQQLGMLKANLHNTITGNAALVETGSMTKMQAAQANIAAQKQAAPAMVHILQTLIAMEKASAGYAHNLVSQKIVASLKAQEATLKAMGSQLGYYSAKVKNVTQNAMTGLFENMMHGQKTWGQMFASFFASIGKSLENILAKSISSAIANALFTKKAGQGIGSIFSFLTGGSRGASSNGGGLIGALFGGSGKSSSAFSGAGIMGASAFSSGGSSTMSSIGGWIKGITSIASLFGFASGANSIPNDMVANIHKGEMIIPAAGASLIRSGQASIGGVPGGNHVHLTVHAMDSQSVISALHSVRAEAAQMFINTASSMNLQGA